ncbi:GTP-binding protein [Thermospira aquatica]|uniref:sulfate adenylyltransferase n=1 Tax=Thermospira aquatica TaxID=2828656 RepID=A0AAX3BAU4_9SPIR|nr:GTP-binding protein [Thermospira aquatica]URA09225.1 adenylyl-sulfate kinase [Thermospira aquatica]
MTKRREQVTIVSIGHVDHGKSTLIGRLLADTNSLPEGKLEAIKAYCEKNAKVFEYAFLLDALKEEQAQGITIDAARCFFKTDKRDYLIIDAPGHFEFVKNMITGASRADASIIVIDAKEGIRENTKRHGYLLSILGIANVCVAVNKMDLVNYEEKIFRSLQEEYTGFLSSVGITEVSFIPISARNGENIVHRSENLRWFSGRTLLEEIEQWKLEDESPKKDFRLFVQDVYKFTEGQDERRIIAGTIDYGEIHVGDRVVFSPSGKKSHIETIEIFPHSLERAYAGQSIGLTISDNFYYVSPGELLSKEGEKEPYVSKRFLAHVFWIENAPLLVNKPYQAKIGTQNVVLRITNIQKVIDSTDPQNITNKDKLERYDIGVCVIENTKPVVFDAGKDFKKTARFVIINEYHISGCGIILEPLEDKFVSLEEEIAKREKLWEKGYISKEKREKRNQHQGKFVLLTGQNSKKIQHIAKLLEKKLFELSKNVYFLSLNSIAIGLDQDLSFVETNQRYEEIRRLGELAHILTDAGLIFISYLSYIEKHEWEILKLLNTPYEILTIGIGIAPLPESDFYTLCYPEKIGDEEILKGIINTLADKEVITLEYYL